MIYIPPSKQNKEGRGGEIKLWGGNSSANRLEREEVKEEQGHIRPNIARCHFDLARSDTHTHTAPRDLDPNEVPDDDDNDEDDDVLTRRHWHRPTQCKVHRLENVRDIVAFAFLMLFSSVYH